MKIKKTDYKKISRTMKIKYILAFLFIIALIIARQLIIDYQINQSKDNSRIVNIAGKQRMLSQMITKDVYILSNSESDETTVYYLKEVKDAVKEWEQTHIELQNGVIGNEIKVFNNAGIQKIYEEIQPYHDQILESTYDFIKYIEEGGVDQHVFDGIVSIVEENEIEFLNGMEKIVDRYDEYSSDRIQSIDNIEKVLFWIIIAAILFVVFVIILPSEQELNKAFNEINEAKEGLEKIFNMEENIIFLVDEDTLNVKMMSEDGKRIINRESVGGFNIVDALDLISVDKKNLINKIKTEEKISQMEVTINQKDENKFFLLSSTKVKYLGEASILISLFDITIQKNAENLVKNQSIRDELTGLYNRYFLNEIIGKEMSRASRYNFQLSGIVFDIDFFKSINDTWGHPVGDIILKETADLASRNLRHSDILFRIGGDEFLLIMPHTNLKQATQVAEKIRSEIENINHQIIGKYTASFGVAQWDKSETFKEIYERVDEALYIAKDKGRNRVINSKNRTDLKTESISFDWKPEWESGNKVIDEQHKELLKIASEFIFLSLPKSGLTDPEQKIDNLIKHVLNHIKSEQGILKSVGYIGYNEHAELHEKIRLAFEDLKSKYNRGEVKLSAFFTYMFDEVLIGHMLDEDIKFFPFLKDLEEENK